MVTKENSRTPLFESATNSQRNKMDNEKWYLPPEFGNWNSVYRYFCRLQQNRHGTGAKKGLHIGKSKGGNTTKIHVFADKYARAVNIVLSAGNVNDITVAPILLEGTALSVIMADKAYCVRSFLDRIRRKNVQSCIPCSRSFKLRWEIDAEQYKKRNVVERLFCT